MDKHTLIKIKECLDELFKDRPMPTEADLEYDARYIALYAELASVWNVLTYLGY